MKNNAFFEKTSAFLKKNSEILVPTVTLFAICLVITLALSLTNLLTADTIKQLEAKTQNEAMSQLLPAQQYDTVEITAETALPTECYAAVSADKITGYIFTVTAKGYGGDVKVMTAIDNDGKVIAATILSVADETPGLGQNVTKEDFYKQFNGMSGSINVLKNGADNANNEVNAVTGATISSKAVTSAVNQALELFEHVTAVLPETDNAQTDGQINGEQINGEVNAASTTEEVA